VISQDHIKVQEELFAALRLARCGAVPRVVLACPQRNIYYCLFTLCYIHTLVFALLRTLNEGYVQNHASEIATGIRDQSLELICRLS
jgi:hypothetical protein